MGIFDFLPRPISQRCGCSGSKDLSAEEKSKQEEFEDMDDVDVDTVERPGGDATRAQWGSQTEFLLTCIGYSVGLGNVWRFPYLCYQSGGGAFLIPYLIMMVIIGMPLLFMEYSFGQYFGVGSLSIFKKVCPMFQGIGVGYVVLNGLVCIYYNVIIALALYYLFASFTAELPWGHCNNPWNTPQCGDPITNKTISNITQMVESINTTSIPYGYTGSLETYQNSTILQSNASLVRVSPSEEYWRYALFDLRGDENVENLGHIRWHLCLCLLLAWIFVLAFVCKGIKSTGKVVYFTATFPYVMLTVLVVRGVTLPGAKAGLIYFLNPEWSRLAEPGVWFGAASQLFYSTNLAWGGMITMASYNEFTHNTYRDAIAINFVSFFTSLYAGLAVFSVIGYMAYTNNVEVSEVIDSGPGLAFIVYPRALGLMPLAPMWSFLFFFMLFLLGIGSQIVIFETIVTALVDKFPVLGKKVLARFGTSLCLGILFFLLALPQVTQGGMYVLQLMDNYAATFCVLIIAIMECIAISWVYGAHTFAANVKEMLGVRPKRWWLLCWKFFAPTVITAILIFSFVKYKPAKYGDYVYPQWAEGVGWIMTLAATLPILIVAVYKFVHAEGVTWRDKLRYCSQPQMIAERRINGIEIETPQKNTDKKGGEDALETLETLDESSVQRRSLLIEKGLVNMDTSVV